MLFYKHLSLRSSTVDNSPDFPNYFMKKSNATECQSSSASVVK